MFYIVLLIGLNFFTQSLLAQTPSDAKNQTSPTPYFALIETLPADAEIYLNDKKVGQGTPLILQLPKGKYRLKAVSGAFSSEETFTIIAGNVQRKITLGNAPSVAEAKNLTAAIFDEKAALAEIRRQFNALSQVQHPDLQAGEATLAENIVDNNRVEIRWKAWVTIPWTRAWIDPPLAEGTLAADAVVPVFLHWEGEQAIIKMATSQGSHQLKSLHPPVGKVVDAFVLKILVHSDYIAYGGAKQVLLETLPLSDEYLTLPGEHEEELWTIAISADSTHFASASEAGAIILLSLVGEELEPKTLLGHSDGIYGLDFSPDGALLASGSKDNTFKVWVVASGKLLKTYTTHKDAVWSVAFSPDGQLLASGSWDNTVNVWAVASGKLLKTYTTHKDAVWSVAFSPDGQLLASGSWDGTVNLWQVEPEPGKRLQTFRHSDKVWSVAFSPDGQVLYSGGNSGVWVWDVSDF